MAPRRGKISGNILSEIRYHCCICIRSVNLLKQVTELFRTGGIDQFLIHHQRLEMVDKTRINQELLMAWETGVLYAQWSDNNVCKEICFSN